MKLIVVIGSVVIVRLWKEELFVAFPGLLCVFMDLCIQCGDDLCIGDLADTPIDVFKNQSLSNAQIALVNILSVLADKLRPSGQNIDGIM